jgi:hypothetical protein
VSPRAGLDAVAKRKISSHCRESNPDRPAPSLVTILIELSGLILLGGKKEGLEKTVNVYVIVLLINSIVNMQRGHIWIIYTYSGSFSQNK